MRRTRYWGTAVGFAVAVVVCCAPVEIFLRHFPLIDQHVFPAAASTPGTLAPDPRFVVGYTSWEAFRHENAVDLEPLLVADAPPAWIFLGNSFVHGSGMIVDHVRPTIRDRRIITLHRTDLLPLRCAQARLLNQHASAVERMFLPLSTVDLLGLGEHPLSTLRVGNDGALTYEPRLPPEPWASLIRESALATTAWFRTGRQRVNLGFDKRRLDLGLDETLRGDLQRLFGNLAEATRGTPITVLLIPSYQQLVARVADGYQRDMRALLEPIGYDVVDPLPALRDTADAPALFLPDKHFTARANQILVTELLRHLRRESPP